jgi:hypothetical protein
MISSFKCWLPIFLRISACVILCLVIAQYLPTSLALAIPVVGWLLIEFYLASRRAKKVEAMVDSTFGRDFPRRNSAVPLLPLDKNNDWVNGVAPLAGQRQPVCVRVAADGLEICYVRDSKRPPLFVSFEKIRSLVVRTYSAGGQMAELHLNKIENEVLIPWNEELEGRCPRE